jgi:hypothetical protein
VDATQAILSALADILDDEDAVRGKDAILAALAAAGFKIVAREPSETMMQARWGSGIGTLAQRSWRAMWDAAP